MKTTMKKNIKILSAVLLIIAMLVACGSFDVSHGLFSLYVQAYETGFSVYNAVSAQLFGDACVRTASDIGSYVGDIKESFSGLRFTVNSQTATNSTLRIFYRSDRRGGIIKVNGSSQQIDFPDVGWSTWGVKAVNISLNAGNNIVEFTGGYLTSYAPDIQKIELTGVSSSTPSSGSVSTGSPLTPATLNAYGIYNGMHVSANQTFKVGGTFYNGTQYLYLHMRKTTESNKRINSLVSDFGGNWSWSYTIPASQLTEGTYNLCIRSAKSAEEQFCESYNCTNHKDTVITIVVETSGQPFLNDNAFVFYNQYNYGGYSYGSGKTLSSSGCGLVAFAMAANALLPQTITPADALNKFNTLGIDYSWNGNSRCNWLTKMAASYGLRRENVTASESTINNALRNGKLIMISGKGASPYTSSGHYILIRGVTSDGKWKIADSNGTANNTKTYSPSAIINGNNGDAVAIYR